MNHIKSVITSTNAEGVIQVRFIDNTAPFMTPGRRIQFLALEGVSFVAPTYAHILSTGTTFSFHYPDTTELFPGQELLLSNSAGNGFPKPGQSQKFLINIPNQTTSYLANFTRFLAEASSNEIAVITEQNDPRSFPEKVEKLNVSEISEASEWADHILFETTADRLAEFSHKNVSPLSKKDQRKISILVHADLGCGGKGDCGLCLTRTTDGRRLSICDKGPVLRYSDLFG